MKIIKLPIKKTKFTCKHCGCIFKFENKDFTRIPWSITQINKDRFFNTECPFCKYAVEEKVIYENPSD